MSPQSLKQLKYKSREEAVLDHQKNYRSSGFAKGKFDPDSPDIHRINRIIGNIEDGSKVLDCGCNDGGLGYILQQRGCVVFGVDVVQELVDIALNRGLLARVCPVEEIDYPDRSFDAVIMAETMEHLFDPEDGVKQCHRVLKDQGVFLGSVPHPDGGLGRKHKTGGDYHQNIFELEELREMFGRYFDVVEILETPYYEAFCEETGISKDMNQWVNWICRKKKV